MLTILINIYRAVFARRIFYSFNKLLFRLSLCGLGVLNSESSKVSGESKFIRTFFKTRQDCIVLDVGANVGKYSLEIMQKNPNARILAFEPHPKTFRKLCENVHGHHVEAYNLAVGDNDGELTLYDYKDNDGSSHASVYKDVIEDIHGKESVGHNVKVVRLGEFLIEKDIEHVALLKIDTEGNELAVLEGVRQYIISGKIEAIHFEFNEMNISSRTFFKDLWNILSGYEFYRLLPDGMVKINNYTPVFCEIFAYQNIVALLKRV